MHVLVTLQARQRQATARQFYLSSPFFFFFKQIVCLAAGAFSTVNDSVVGSSRGDTFDLGCCLQTELRPSAENQVHSYSAWGIKVEAFWRNKHRPDHHTKISTESGAVYGREELIYLFFFFFFLLFGSNSMYATWQLPVSMLLLEEKTQTGPLHQLLRAVLCPLRSSLWTKIVYLLNFLDGQPNVSRS